MRVGLVVAGCGSPEPVPDGLLAEAAREVRAEVVLAARSGGRGEGPGVPEALLRLRRAGVDRAVVATTHLVAGAVHRRCALDAARAARLFPELRLARPLLAGEKDVRAVASALSAALPARAGRAVVLAGHAGEAAGLAHLALEHALWAAGRGDALVGAPEDLARAALPGGAREVLLAPLAMGLGTHARRDVLGGLRRALEARGVGVEARSTCLLDLPAVRALLLAHAREARLVRGSGVGRVAGDASGTGDDRAAAGAMPGRADEPAPGTSAAPVRPGRFPLFVDLAGAPCLVVGCGAVGSRRARALLAHGARVRVVDPRGSGPEGARRLARGYEPGDEEGMRLVVAATDSRPVNTLVARRCREAGIPVSVADAPAEGSFAFPALCETDHLVAGVVSRAGEHALVSAAAAVVRDDLGWMEGAWGDTR